MNREPGSKEQLTEDFIARSGIDIAADIGTNSGLIPVLVEVDEAGSLVKHATEGGADYYFSQLSYRGGDEVKANRMIAEILPGNRTELAYWAISAPAKQLKVHKGRGILVVSDPLDGSTENVAFDDKELSEVVLKPGVFYALCCAEDSVESLFISGFYDSPVDWGALETVVQPGQRMAVTNDGIIEVPENFRNL